MLESLLPLVAPLLVAAALLQPLRPLAANKTSQFWNATKATLHIT